MTGPVKARQLLDQQIAEQLKRQEQLKADIASLKDRAKVIDRKLDTRLKIVGGAAVFAHARVNPAFREQMEKVFDLAVTRPQDRALLRQFFPKGAPAGSVSREEHAEKRPEKQGGVSSTQRADKLPETQGPAAPPRPSTPPQKPPSGAAPA